MPAKAPPEQVPPAHALANSASQQVERTTAPPALASAARDNVAAQAQTPKIGWQARVLARLRRYPRAAESAAQQGIVPLAITLD